MAGFFFDLFLAGLILKFGVIFTTWKRSLPVERKDWDPTHTLA